MKWIILLIYPHLPLFIHKPKNTHLQFFTNFYLHKKSRGHTHQLLTINTKFLYIFHFNIIIMVLEAIFNPFTIKKHPIQMFVAGAMYSFVAFLLAYIVFKEISGILMVFLVVLASLPIIYTTIKEEEEIELHIEKEWTLLKEHTKILMLFMALFMGILFAFSTIYIFSPESVVNDVFTLQHKAISDVSAGVQGAVIQPTASFSKIFMNNIKVLFFCLVFSLLYGSGAIFILTWNASVIAAAIGNVVKQELAIGISSYFAIATFSFFKYMSHGILEIAAYLVAGLAGGIISIAVIKHNLKEKRILFDAVDLVLISIALLFVAGIMEVYVTPILF